MKIIKDLLARDLKKQIEEVIKLDQRDEQTVHDEITEYVATDRIQKQYVDVLQALADGPGDPNERTAVWISGFFGSGKSSFAKNLGYILSNRELLGTPGGKLFTEHLKQQNPGDKEVKKIGELVEFINASIPAHVIMFDVQVDRAVRKADETIAEIMYTVLLRELDYAEDYDVAELEIELEGEGRLKKFVEACFELYGDQVKKIDSEVEVPVTLKGLKPEAYGTWIRVRKGAQKIQRASAAMHKIDPKTNANEDSWAQSIRDGVEITIRTLVDRSFDLVAKRKPGHTIVYIIDEVGQYVARSAEKIENLRKLAEHFGQESKNRVQKDNAVKPIWVIVTSQEKLDEVVAAIDDKRVQLARMQDRFYHRIDLAPADIREVATKRVLPKTVEGADRLASLYQEHSGQLKTHTQLERSQIPSEVSQGDFVQFYPYLPHYVELSIDIVSGMRLQAGAPRHIGGSNRTIIKQVYEMLVSDRTKLADEPIGALVTLDRIFDLIEGNLPDETQKDVSEIEENWPGDDWPTKVAKAIVLLEFVRGLPRTEKNLAALLYSSLDSGSPSKDVERAIDLLEEKQFIRQTDEGWKLLTKLEKDWSTERGSLTPAPKERNDIWEEQLRSIFEEPGMNRFTREGRTFRMDVSWQSRTIVGGKGQIPLALEVSDDTERFEALTQEIRKRSREDKQIVFWTFSANDDIDDFVAELYRSQRMVAKYDQLRAQSKINPQETSSLASEKLAALKYSERLKNAILTAFRQGTGFFDGVGKDGSDLGDTPVAILKGMLDFALPKLYPNLDLGNVPVTGKEAEEILRAANLNGLSQVFYDGEDGLGLVIKEGDKFVISTDAPIPKEVMSYVQGEHSFGNKVSGRLVEEHFGGLGYGWDRDVVAVVLASMLRAGAIEVTYQGRKFRNHLDPQVRAAFTGTQSFRSASFAPRDVIDLKTLVSAAKRYEALTGEEVDVDETSIAKAFQDLTRAEMEALLPVEATARANNIPVLGLLDEYKLTLQGILQSASDDVVRTLAGEGESFKAARSQIAQIRAELSEEGLTRLHGIHLALRQMWPVIDHINMDADLGEKVGLAREALQKPDLFSHLSGIESVAGEVEGIYRDQYIALHSERSLAYRDAVDTVKGIPEWSSVPKEEQENVLYPLMMKVCGDEDSGETTNFPEAYLVCDDCHGSLSVLASDIKAVGALRNEVVGRVQAMAAPEERIERVHVAEVAGAYQVLSSPEEVDDVMTRIKDHILKLLDAGAKVILE